MNIHFLQICDGNSKRFSPTEYMYPESWALYIGSSYIPLVMGIRELLYIMLSFPGTYILSGRIKMILPCDRNWCEIHLPFVNIHCLQICAGNSSEIHWQDVNIHFLPICAGNSKWFSPTEYTYPESWALYIEPALIMLSFPGTYILLGRIKIILSCAGNWCEIHLPFVNIHCF